MTRTCLALNTFDWKEAFDLINKLRNEVDMFKVGVPLYINDGKKNVESLIKDGLRIFLDLKLYDIPSVVADSVKELPNVDLLTVHGLGGYEVVRAAVNERPDIKVAVVSILSSTSESWASLIFKKNIRKIIMTISRMAVETGAWGVVVPGIHARHVRKTFKSLNLVVVGVRMRREQDDHEKVISVDKLKWLGDDDIVVIGREITKSRKPLDTLKEIKEKLGI